MASAQSSNEDNQIPSWFKNNVKWWKEDKISDAEIINAIENLLKREIIKFDSTEIKRDATLPETRLFLLPNKDDAKIPSYAKNTFASWGDGMFSDSDVTNTIKFLINSDIISLESTPSYKQPKQLAAIIDQLHDSIPNESFQQKAQQHLENAGYDVDIYTTQDITVDFYKKLPSMNYKFIYIRTHSLGVKELQNSTFLFTGEKYDIDKHGLEQLFGHIRKGVPIIDDELPSEMIKNATMLLDFSYFTIGSKFVNELMVGKFPQTVIIIGGCQSTRNYDLAFSLLSRGASEVVGWDSTITSLENDRVMLALLEEILIDKTGFYDAIPSVMQEFGSDLQFFSNLKHVFFKR